MSTAVGTVTVCSSSRFYPLAREAAKRLESSGFNVLTPSFEHDETQIAVDQETKAELTYAFLEKIRRSDAIYVIAEEGYIGRSVAIEIGYATALGKDVVLSQEAAEDAVKALTTRVVSCDGIDASSFG
jgi:nucleoside 2-deoxyribosyltransferase